MQSAETNCVCRIDLSSADYKSCDKIRLFCAEISSLLKFNNINLLLFPLFLLLLSYKINKIQDENFLPLTYQTRSKSGSMVERLVSPTTSVATVIRIGTYARNALCQISRGASSRKSFFICESTGPRYVISRRIDSSDAHECVLTRPVTRRTRRRVSISFYPRSPLRYFPGSLLR